MEWHEGAWAEGLYQVKCFPSPTSLKPCLFTNAVSHKWERLSADFAGLLPLGHLKIKFSKEYFVFLDRGSIKAFLLMRGCFPLVQRGSRNLCLRNVGHNSERSKQTSQKSSSCKYPPRTAIYTILPVVHKVLWTKRARCGRQGSSPAQATCYGRVLPRCARSEPRELLLYTTQDSKTHGLKLCWEMGIAGGSSRRADKNPLTHTRTVSDAFQRTDTYCRYVLGHNLLAFYPWAPHH